MTASKCRWLQRAPWFVAVPSLVVIACRRWLHLDPEFFGAPLIGVAMVSGAVAPLLRCEETRRRRFAWGLVSAGLFSYAAGELFFFWGQKALLPHYPTVSDVLWLSFYPLVVAGATMVWRDSIQRVPVSRWLDGVIGALLGGAVGAVLFDEVLAPATASANVVAGQFAYPMLDLVVLAALMTALAVDGWKLRSGPGLLATGFLVLLVTDSISLRQVAEGTYVPGTVLDAGWPAAIVLLGAAAASHVSFAAKERPRRELLYLIPLLGFAAASALLAHVMLFGADTVDPKVLAMASLTLVAVVGRLFLSLREHDRLVEETERLGLTDALTELGNRRKLMPDLEAALQQAPPGCGQALVLFDLDEFKVYNDLFGHPAGDALLRRLAARLAAAVEGRGAAYRLGGDEFCVLTAPGVDLERLVLEASLALCISGDGFVIDCSCGTAELPDEAATVDDAFRLADERMYQQKAARPGSPHHLLTKALLQAMAEHSPIFVAHHDSVARLVRSVAQAMQLPAREIDEIVRAAELHDIGKLAVPNTTLAKPGPLTPDEWQLIRQHTVVGERILSVVPTMRSVARLIRSSHERWDGDGYPDGLAGEGIPLGSRIIFVCDALDAMLEQRPYQGPLSIDEALDELRSEAGHQFDPSVVHAALALHERGRLPVPSPFLNQLRQPAGREQSWAAA